MDTNHFLIGRFACYYQNIVSDTYYDPNDQDDRNRASVQFAKKQNKGTVDIGAFEKALDIYLDSAKIEARNILSTQKQKA